MHKAVKKRLHERSWTDAEIEHAHRIQNSAELREKHAHFKKSGERIIFVMALLLLVLAHLLISVVLIPFLVILSSVQLYLVIALFGAMVGLIYNLVIVDLEHLSRRHHLLAFILTPTVAVATLAVVVSVANRISLILGIETRNSAYMVCAVYLAAFLVPYAYAVFHKRT